jgi:hypothetical protein
MHTVLDLDLDVFTSPILYWPQDGGRPSGPDKLTASPEDVRHFLEMQCGLGTQNRIRGREVINHDSAFDAWRDWIQEGTLRAPFSVVHVDAHADMGLGGAGHLYLLSELLACPAAQRGRPQRGLAAMNAGNYLMFAVANLWVSQITHVFPVTSPWSENWNSPSSGRIPPRDYSGHKPNDLFPIHFRNGNVDSGIIELRHCSRETLDNCAGRQLVEPVIHLEPPVPFSLRPVPDFVGSGFTHMVIAQSPKYTPESADKLLSVIRDYFVAA